MSAPGGAADITAQVRELAALLERRGSRPKPNSTDTDAPEAGKPGSGRTDGSGELDAAPIDLQQLNPVIAEMILRGTQDGKPIKNRGRKFFEVVRYLHHKDHGFAAVLATLQAHANGLHAKFVGRLETELRRAWDKLDDDDGDKRRRNTLALVSSLIEQTEWQGALASNQLTETIEIAISLPSTERCERRPLVDSDVLEAMLYAQAHGFPKASKGMVLDALTIIAHRNAYHPVRDYLRSLKWDGIERVRRLFLDYFDADLPTESDQPARDRQVAYLEHVATCFMVGAVARVMLPGCKVDTVPLLVGPQGIGKSTALRMLCHDPDWFSDDISPNLIDKDTKESLRGKWLIELAEIPHVRREGERVKAFFSRREDRYREAYGLLNRDHRRQCIFIGTTNDLEFVDTTGNRRFWPIRASGRIDLARIIAGRDQLWAEAMALYGQGVQWWLPANIEAIAAEVQHSFDEVDVWQDAIAEWIDARTFPDDPFTMAALFEGCFKISDPGLIPKRDQGRAGACLQRLGYQSREWRHRGKRAHWWTNSGAVSHEKTHLFRKVHFAGDGGDTQENQGLGERGGGDTCPGGGDTCPLGGDADPMLSPPVATSPEGGGDTESQETLGVSPLSPLSPPLSRARRKD